MHAENTIIVPDDYPTIQLAIDAANDGMTVLVRSGPYEENIVVDKSLSLIGEKKETTIVRGHSGYPHNVLYVCMNSQSYST